MLVQWQKKQDQNIDLIKRYNAFLMHVKIFEDRIKLISEIGRLHAQNQYINTMTVQNYKEDCLDYSIKITAQWIR